MTGSTGRIEIYLPEGEAIRVEVLSVGMGEILFPEGLMKFDGLPYRPEGIYQTDGFEEADFKLIFLIDAARLAKIIFQ